MGCYRSAGHPRQVVDTAPEGGNVRQAGLKLAAQPVNARPFLLKLASELAVHSLEKVCHGKAQVPDIGGDQFSSRGGCRRPHIGHKVGYGLVSLVAHSADNRRPAGVDGAGNRLLVEGPQVLQRSPRREPQ